ncbi:MAG: hypothetical protein ACRDIX_01035 [Actinomycetota bacterium]
MRLGSAARLAWSLWTTSLGLSVLALIVGVLAGFGWEDLYYGIVGSFVILLFATVGALVGSRQPGNAIGWLFMSFALLQALNVSGTAYAEYALVARPGSLPAGEIVAWFSEWNWVPSIALLITFLLLLFPDGRLPSRKWRWIGWASAAGIAIAVVVSAVSLWPLRHRIVSETFQEPEATPLGVILILTGLALIVIGALGSVASLVARFRRSHGEQRQQLKWFTYAGVLAFIGVMSSFLRTDLTEAPLVLGITAVPVAAGIAILKFRLYDIDRIINRTLVYGILTVFLAGVYVGAVVGLGTLVGDSTILVAASTLLVAALFRPARHRVQSLIDRRFYRSKYDAARTLEAFTARLREEVDLDSLAGDLVGVVRDTIQPAHASLWLRGIEAPR